MSYAMHHLFHFHVPPLRHKSAKSKDWWISFSISLTEGVGSLLLPPLPRSVTSSEPVHGMVCNREWSLLTTTCGEIKPSIHQLRSRKLATLVLTFDIGASLSYNCLKAQQTLGRLAGGACTPRSSAAGRGPCISPFVHNTCKRGQGSFRGRSWNPTKSERGEAALEP